MFAKTQALKANAGILFALGTASPSFAQGTFYVVTDDARLGTSTSRQARFPVAGI